MDAGDLPPLPAAIETAAFRIATEATMNSARHSGSDHSWVEIRTRDGCLDIAESTVTVVSDEFFDALLDALERPPKKNEALARRAQQRRRVTQH